MSSTSYIKQLLLSIFTFGLSFLLLVVNRSDDLGRSPMPWKGLRQNGLEALARVAYVITKGLTSLFVAIFTIFSFALIIHEFGSVEVRTFMLHKYIGAYYLTTLVLGIPASYAALGVFQNLVRRIQGRRPLTFYSRQDRDELIARWRQN